MTTIVRRKLSWRRLLVSWLFALAFSAGFIISLVCLESIVAATVSAFAGFLVCRPSSCMVDVITNVEE